MTRALHGPSTRLLISCLALACACGGATRETPAASTDPVATRASEADPTVLRIGGEARAGGIRLLGDGTVRGDDFVFGRVAADGTLYRPNGSVCARVARDGTITLADPGRADPAFGGMRIEDDALWMVADGQTMELARIVDGALVTRGERQPIEGLNPDNHLAVLAARALFMLVAAVERPVRAP